MSRGYTLALDASSSLLILKHQGGDVGRLNHLLREAIQRLVTFAREPLHQINELRIVRRTSGLCC